MNLPTLRTEVAFTTDPDATLPVYDDISPTRALHVRRGRLRELDIVQASTGESPVNNDDRRFDPTYTHSPYYPNVVPMRRLRHSAVWNAVTYYLLTGFVERWTISWEAPERGSVDITAVDGLAALAQATISGDFPEELSGARIARVLTAAHWPESTPQTGGYWALGTSALGVDDVLSYGIPETVIDAGRSLVQAVTFEEGSGQSALAHIQEVAAAERGLFFIDAQGRAVFQDRFARYGAVSAVTFTDNLISLSSTRLQYRDLLPEFDVEQLANEVIVTRTGGTPQTARDTASIARYGRRTLTLSLPLTTDEEALDRAAFELTLRKEPRLEFTRLTVKPQAQPAAWPFALGLELGDRVTIERTPDSVASIVPETINREGFVEAIQHDLTPNEWITSFQLSPADAYGRFWALSSSALDDATNPTMLAY